MSKNVSLKIYKRMRLATRIYAIVFYTNLTHLLNNQTGFFDKMCQ